MVYNLKDEVNHLVKIYFIRHCEAEGNKAKIFQGSTDCDVSDKGARQLEYLKKRFENIHIDKAIASPLKRAYKTALAAVEGKGLEVIADPDFTEIHGGFIEGGLNFIRHFALRNNSRRNLFLSLFKGTKIGKTVEQLTQNLVVAATRHLFTVTGDKRNGIPFVN